MQKQLTFSSRNISVYAIFYDQSFNNMLTNDIVNFEQLGPGSLFIHKVPREDLSVHGDTGQSVFSLGTHPYGKCLCCRSFISLLF